MITVQVAYKTIKENIAVPEQTPVSLALKDNQWYQQYLAEVSTPTIGIFGKIITEDYLLQDNDRIELYFPLTLDPMSMRHTKVNPHRYHEKNFTKGSVKKK